MSRMIFTLMFVALALSTDAASAQTQGPATPETQIAREVPRRCHLNGPRFGFTVFTGDVADTRGTRSAWNPS